MKLCLDCLEELFDKDTICPKCNKDTYIIDEEEVSFIKNNINSCNRHKLNNIIKDYKCCRVYEYLKLKESRDFNRPKVLISNTIDINPSYKKGKAIEKQKPSPKCPTCSSINIRKMSGIERGASIATFGLFSKKINKTFKCNGCGYTW